jgi:hypothetical protein
MAAKKRPTAKRIVESPPARQGTAQGNGRGGPGSTTPRNGRASGSGQRPGGKGGSSYQASSPKQAAKARSRSAAIEVPRRRISGPMIGWSAGAVIVLVVGIFIVIAVTRTTPKVTGTGRVNVPASVLKAVTNVPASILDSVGIGNQPASKTTSAANAVAPVPAAQQASATIPPVAGGQGSLPVFFYYGGEFCPYCATERWSLIVALSRFGTFSGLKGMASSPSDFAPSTQTFTFYHSTYSSPYFRFLPVETEDINHAALEQPTRAELKVLSTWDPHFSFPFIDIGGKYIGGLPGWLDPTLLHGLSRADIAQALSVSGNVAGTPIDANANYITAAICNMDGGKPGSVCTSKGVMAAQAQFKNLAPAKPL